MTGSPESFVVATAEVGVTAPEGYSPQQVEALHPHKGGDKTAPPLAEPVQEPVAWMIYTEGGTSAYVTDNPNDLVGAYRALALYTAPPQRKPLTEDEILSVLRLAPPEPSLWPHLKDEAVVGDVQRAVLAIARAIERAHGVGEKK